MGTPCKGAKAGRRWTSATGNSSSKHEDAEETAAPRAHRCRPFGCRRTEVEGLALAQALTSSSTAAAISGPSRPMSPNGGTAPESPSARATCCASCDLDLGEADVALRSGSSTPTSSRAARRAHPPPEPSWRSGASRCKELTEGEVAIDRSVDLQVRFPAHRLMPARSSRPRSASTVAPVCGARTLAEGRPRWGSPARQQDVAHVYPLARRPRALPEDFAERAAEHARDLAERIERQRAERAPLPRAETARTSPRPLASRGSAPPPALIVLAVLAFLAGQRGARPLAVDGVGRARQGPPLLEAEAGGDAQSMLRQLHAAPAPPAAQPCCAPPARSGAAGRSRSSATNRARPTRSARPPATRAWPGHRSSRASSWSSASRCDAADRHSPGARLPCLRISAPIDRQGSC